MGDIKIFVSHRIDINSELVNNPLYVPVRCGAVFDKENPMGIAGDDTGDNISEKRMNFCEFTVQYWAWKNVEADYYGLCHYRRYLSFAEQRYKTDYNNMINVPLLTDKNAIRYALTDSLAMSTLISQYDIITSEYADVRKIWAPGGTYSTLWDMWNAYSGTFFESGSLLWLLDAIDRHFPQYSASAREYFSGTRHRGYNCYVLRRDLFLRLCEFEFPILFELEDELKARGRLDRWPRAPGYLGEMLYGIFLYHVTTYEHWRMLERQLVFFYDTHVLHGPFSQVYHYAQYHIFRMTETFIFPKGSRRRAQIKKIIHRING